MNQHSFLSNKKRLICFHIHLDEHRHTTARLSWWLARAYLSVWYINFYSPLKYVDKWTDALRNRSTKICADAKCLGICELLTGSSNNLFFSLVIFFCHDNDLFFLPFYNTVDSYRKGNNFWEKGHVECNHDQVPIAPKEKKTKSYKKSVTIAKEFWTLI